MTHEPERPRNGSTAIGVPLVVVAASIGAGISGASPTGTAAADVVWSVATAAVVVLAGSRSRTAPLMWLATIAALVAVRGDAHIAILGVAALAGTISLALFDRLGARSDARAATAGAAIVALMGAPSYGIVALPTLVACLAVIPVLWSGWTALGRRGRRRSVVAALAAVAALGAASVIANVTALSARKQLSAASQQAQEGLRLVRAGQVEDAATLLDSAAAGFSDVESSMNGTIAFPGRLVPVVGHQVEAVRRLSQAGAELTRTGAETARRADPNQLRTSAGAVDLSAVEAMWAPTLASLKAAEETRSIIADVRSPWLLQPIDDKLDELDAELSDSIPSVKVAADALGVVPQLLGSEGPRRYLLQFATPGEARGAGGYIGSYGVLVADHGRLTLESTGSTEPLNVPLDQEPRPFVPPPGWENRYATDQVGRYPGNLSADPDWPTDSEVARQLYAQVPSVGHIDGTLYADPTALAGILRMTGPVDVLDLPDTTTLTADNVERYLLLDQYELFTSDVTSGNAARRDALAQATTAVFDAFVSRELPSLGDIVDELGPAVAGGHLKVMSFDPAAAELLATTGLSGAWDPEHGADYLSVRVTDLLANKIEYFLDRSIGVEVVHDPESGEIRSVVTISLTNTAPDSGMPFYVTGNYDDLPIGTNRSDISVYTPLDLESATLDGTEIGMGRNAYGNGEVLSFPVQLAPGQTRTLRLELHGILATAPYRLEVLPQPLASPDQLRVTINTGGGPVIGFEGAADRPVMIDGASAG